MKLSGPLINDHSSGSIHEREVWTVEGIRVSCTMSLKAARVVPRSQPLTEAETVALRMIADGSAIQPPLYKRLKKLGVIASTAAGWALTPDGHIGPMFDNAR